MDIEKVETAVGDLLLALGVDEGEHTRDTPGRVALAMAEMLAGYAEDPRTHLERRFSAPEDPGLILVAGIRMVSTCAHHLLPVTGTVTVGYRPRRGDSVVGLSKLARVVRGYARRLQVQERLGYQIANAIQECLDPVGAGCVITAAHGCMTARGVNEPVSVMTVHSLAGKWTQGHPDVVALTGEHARQLG